MPQERLPMRKIRDVLRLSAGGMSKRKIAASLGVSPTAACDCIRRSRRAGLSWPLPEAMSDAALEARLYPPPPSVAKEQRPRPDWATIHRELKRPGVTLQLLWGEHRTAHPDGYGYSRFCELYRGWEGRLSPTMRQTHVAGERMFVDYAGTTIEAIDGMTGEVMRAQLFVAVLGASSYTYAEATWTQGLADWIGSRVRTFAFIGGVPAQTVSRQLEVGHRQGVLLRAGGQPHLCGDGGPLRHGDRAGAPLQAARQGQEPAPAKAGVEVAVLVATRWIIAKLRKRTFFSLAELNAAVAVEVAALNARVTRHLASCALPRHTGPSV